MPENTFSSFYLSIFLKDEGIETDVRRTKDNKLVLIHDKSIDRTSNGVGKVSELTYDELLKYNFGDNKIVLLEDFFKYIGNFKINILLELKERNCEKDVIYLINKYKIKNIIIISFKLDILKNLKNIDPGIKVGYLAKDCFDNTISNCIDNNVDYFMPISLFVNSNLIKRLNNSFKVIVWGIKNNNEFKRINKYNIYGMISDSAYKTKRILVND